MKRNWLIGACALASLALTGAVVTYAQNVEGLDIQALHARGDAQAKEQADFAREIAKRGAEMRDQAMEVQRGAMANRARFGTVARPGAMGANGIDLDSMLASANGAMKAGKDAKAGFIAFASLSMPSASLKQMMREVGGAGGIVVFRGFPGNSARQFLAGISKAVDKGQELHGVGIDPRLFRAFNVTEVPTYVVVSSDFQPCDGFHCTTGLPPYDRISGNVTPHYALTTIGAGGGPGAAVAKVYLASLDRLTGQ
ncbi:type-F conjugative transfer system pilin assembly protein TrbC [Sphingomonas oryzagri]